MALAPTCHSEVVLRQWEALSTLLGTSAKPVALDGKSVDICEVVSIARYVLQIEVLESRNKLSINRGMVPKLG